MRLIDKFLAMPLLVLAISCSTPKDITYMQGFENGMTQEVRQQQRITVQPDDKLSILVSAKDPALAEVFNLSVAQRTVGQRTTNSTTNSQGISAFTVTPDGYVKYPIIGELHVAGMSRNSVARMIEHELETRNLLKDPIVTVEFLNATVSVLGDVSSPGEYPIDRDNMNIIQAISKAGDLNITGMRQNVLVVREENGKDVAYRLDLTDTRSLFQSPAFYLQQNDIVYVEPNNVKKRQATVNGNTVLTPGFWMSVASFLISLSVLIFR